MGYISQVTGDLSLNTSDADEEFMEDFEENIYKAAGGHDYMGYFIDEIDPYNINFCNSGKAYDLADELRAFITTLDESGIVVNGTLYREGEDAGDVERFDIKDSQLVNVEKARLVWKDGSEYSS